jgi:pimeloyl-ACP methyl ester carboxylesterase
VGGNAFLRVDRIRSVAVAEDYTVVGMQAHYRNGGHGVPVVVERVIPKEEPRSAEECLYPRRTWAPATAVLYPGGGLRGGAWRSRPCAMVLHYPFETSSVTRGPHVLRLAGDRTTALAVHSSNVDFAKLAKRGLLDGQFARSSFETGLFSLQPYQPGKVPVVLVHGLNDSYSTWFQTLNHLRNDPEIAARYQFWVFMYPTGNPVVVSAAYLRRAIREARDCLDPGRSEPAWDRMVVVGHSMGGLLTKVQIESSGSGLDRQVFTRPLEEVKADPETRQLLYDTMRFEPVPEVQRVVFVATPHRGSHVASQLVGRVVNTIVGAPTPLADAARRLRKMNGPGLFQDSFKLRHVTSVANLRFNSPALQLLGGLPFRPDVPYHTIAFRIPLGPTLLPTDGVVPYTSAHLDGAASELVLPGNHLDHQKPEVTAELKRILRLHQGETDALWGVARGTPQEVAPAP